VGKGNYIDAPELLTRRQRTAGALITAVMWGAYAYLWLPLVSLLAWGLGVEFAYEAMVRAGGASALRTALFWYAVMLLAVVLTVSIWSLLNKWRFAGSNRRTAHSAVADESMADYFGVTLGDLARLRSAPRVELDIDALGRPTIPTPRPSGRRDDGSRSAAVATAAVRR
jgi:poly-beta-1,6-N-acetyl-D-glucosamine biosynthesis protein PgaD